MKVANCRLTMEGTTWATSDRPRVPSGSLGLENSERELYKHDVYLYLDPKKKDVYLYNTHEPQ